MTDIARRQHYRRRKQPLVDTSMGLPKPIISLPIERKIVDAFDAHARARNVSRAALSRVLIERVVERPHVLAKLLDEKPEKRRQ